MNAPKTLLQASVHAGRAWLRPMSHFLQADPQSEEVEATPVMVPIRSLGPAYRQRIADHLMALEPSDRYLRFGYTASDEQIQRYVDKLDFNTDEIFGIYNRHLELIAMAHVAFSQDAAHKSCAEFGVSVL